MTTPDLTPTLRDALTKAINADKHHNFLSAEEFDAFIDLRNDCPERPALEDGRYEVPDEDGDYRVRYVRDGRFASHRLSDGTLYGGYPLPDDASTWRRIDGPPTVTPEQIEEAARAASYCSEPQWADLAEASKGYWRGRARRTLAAAGIEVQP